MTTHELFKKKETSELVMRTLAREMPETIDPAIQIFTDGSKDGRGRVGAAFFVPQREHEESFRLTDHVAIHTAEMMAIRQALQYLITEKPKTAVIYSDSLGALQSLDRGESRTRPNLTREVIELNHSINTSETATRLQWVPSHVGLGGNERADRLAKEALDQPSIRIQVNKEPMEIYQEIDGISRARWQQYWDDCLVGRHFYAIQKEVGNETRFKERRSLWPTGNDPPSLNGVPEPRDAPHPAEGRFWKVLETNQAMHDILKEERSLQIIAKYVSENQDLAGRI